MRLRKVRYQYSRHDSQEESMNYLEFIARVTSHIPDKGQVMIRSILNLSVWRFRGICVAFGVIDLVGSV